MPTIYQHLSNKKLDQRIIHISNMDYFFNVLKEFVNNDQFIYRGINSKAKIYPKIIRNNENDSKKEFDILDEFENYFALYETAYNCWDFISLAQHNGISTRLIDFTSNIYVAFFFSLWNRKGEEESYEIYVADKNNYSSVNKAKMKPIVKNTKGDSFVSCFKSEIQSSYYSNSVLLTPKFSNNKIFVQQGLFLVPIVLTKHSVDELFQGMPFVIIVEEKVRCEILDYLNSVGFNEYRLMPGIENICKAINEKYGL